MENPTQLFVLLTGTRRGVDGELRRATFKHILVDDQADIDRWMEMAAESTETGREGFGIENIDLTADQVVLDRRGVGTFAAA